MEDCKSLYIGSNPILPSQSKKQDDNGMDECNDNGMKIRCGFGIPEIELLSIKRRGKKFFEKRLRSYW